MTTVLFITDLHTGTHVLEISGVFERAAEFGWRVIEIERDRTTSPLKDFVDTWNPSGCILECGNLTQPVDTRDFGGIPLVYIDPPEGTPDDVFKVTNNSESLARKAATELEHLGCASYAYVGWCRRTSWSVNRGKAFVKALAEHGHSCAVHEAEWQDTFAIQKKLAKWLLKLRRPVGVFAANDYAAQQIAGACALAELECPTDVAIVGVDNDMLVCENTFPSISSIEPDFREAGRLAADLMHEQLDGAVKSGERHRSFGPLTLARRQSTRAVKTGDRRIIMAVERIRRDACFGLKAADIIADIGLSRRLAERRFRAATGKTILGEINDVRFAEAKRLLRDNTVPIGFITGKCGWESDSYFKRFFKSRTGMTPRNWRKQATKAD
ncbi:MAG: helix-turn-helix domain-containing protein [Lentisphaerae bacterium]|nr:helix-turn-helix domain-containing protein [Lentisphaerota bacterium]